MQQPFRSSHRIVILTNGSRGDVQPYIALGLGLQQSGYEVLLAADARFQQLVEDYELPFAAIGGDVRELLESKTAIQLRDSGQQLRWMLYAIRESGAYLSRGYVDAWELCLTYQPDLIIFTIATPVGYSIAERLGIPCCYAGLQPIHATHAFPSVWLKSHLLPSKAFNQLSHQLFDQLFWQTHRTHLNRFRREHLGLSALPFFGPTQRQIAEGMPILYGFSPTVVPPPNDWPSSLYMAGYWFLDPPPNWTPPVNLTHFLAAGPAPVYVGFGSMASAHATSTTRLICTALHRAGQRGILVTGWGGLIDPGMIHPNVLVLAEVPHSYLLPRTAAVVHHGGAGTTAAALHAGVPSIIIPYIADHFFWGEHVAALGAGPTPIVQHRLNADSLAAAIQTAVSDAGLIQRGAEVGKMIQAEDGVGKAIRFINTLLGVADTIPEPEVKERAIG